MLCFPLFCTLKHLFLFHIFCCFWNVNNNGINTPGGVHPLGREIIVCVFCWIISVFSFLFHGNKNVSLEKALILTNARILLIGPFGILFSEISIEIHTFSVNKIQSKYRLENDGHFISASMCWITDNDHNLQKGVIHCLHLSIFFCLGFTAISLCDF